jgi:hypothetical protein
VAETTPHNLKSFAQVNLRQSLKMTFVPDDPPSLESQAVATEWRTARSAKQIVRETGRLFAGYGWAFLILGAAVVVPFEVLSVATVGWNWDLAGGQGAQAWLLFALNLVVVVPMISALQVHAAAAARRGESPKVIPIARRGLASLPLVAGALIPAALLVSVGLVLLVIPGIVLLLRWTVVAQVAAIERLDWMAAMKRSHGLSRGNYRHIALVLLFVFVVNLGIAAVFRDGSTANASVPIHLLALVGRISILSFDALAIGVLYFDLLVRESPAVGPVAPSLMAPRPRETPPVPLMGASGPASAHPQDPRRYSDGERPPGWYVDPDSPDKMRFWMSLGKPPRWGGAARTSRRLRREWQELQVD